MKNKKIKKPNFFIVGAARSGTTTLYYILKKHPQIFMSATKEPNFFCEDQYYKKINNWEEYLGLFKKVKNEKIVGEASVKYLYSKTAASNIKFKIKNPKILILLRNPLNRAFSHYRWEKRADKEKLNFKDAIKKEPERINQGWSFSYHYTQVGMYYKQVKRFIDTFGRKNVKIILFEEFTKNHQKILKEIYEFLEIKPLLHNKISHYNISNKLKIKKINQFMGKNYLIQRWLKKIIPSEMRKKIVYYIINKLNVSQPKIEINLSKQEKLNLYKKFIPDIKKLGSLTKKDFSIWIPKNLAKEQKKIDDQIIKYELFIK